jgi:hypothetical protein
VTRRRLLVGLTVALGLAWRRGAAQSLEPLEVDWEQVFRITWEVGERYRKPRLFGRIQNVSFYGASQIQLLVELLDGGGRPVSQQVAWLGYRINPGDGAFFDVPVPERGGTYRVRVYAFTRKFGTSGT